MKLITVLVAFTEQRSGKHYDPGDVVTDPQWHDPADRRAAAYAARGLVKIENAPAAEPEPQLKPRSRKAAKE